MESEKKRRSGSYGDEKAFIGESKSRSQSDGDNIDRETSPNSPESSEAGTLKKPKKFRPKKFLAKRFKNLRKSEKSGEEQEGVSGRDESEQESSKKSSTSNISEKMSSPKLSKFNIVKRFSGTRSYKVTPITDDDNEESHSNLRKLESLSASEASVKKAEADNKSEPSTDVVSFEEEEEVFVANDTKTTNTSASTNTSTKESVTLESKKVQLKITISGKKVEKRNSPSPNAVERAIDGASPPTQLPNEQTTSTADIKFPLGTQLSRSREKFFNDMVLQYVNTDDAGQPKPITDDNADSFATVVKEGYSVKSAPVESANEVEKYQFLTSSLNTIITAAKELDELSTEANLEASEIKFPELADLTIRENVSEGEEQELKAIAEENQVKTVSGVLASSTPNKSSQPTEPEASESETDEMKRQSKKSKIPIDQSRLSLTPDKENVGTVRTQEASKPYHVSLSPSTSEESRLNIKPEIKFELGTPVRPQRTSPAVSTSILAPLAGPETPSVDEGTDESFEVFHSPKNESLRRRIPFVPQLSIYTQEEQELLRSNFEANADSIPPDSSIFPVFDESAGNTMTSALDKREHLYKILVIGELGTGKTSFIKRYVHQFFSQNYRATIGVDFALKVLNWDQSTIIRLQLWDIAGQERFGNMTRVYYKEAVGAFIVFDVTRSATFDAVLKWKQDLDTKVQLPDGGPIPCILLANKCDQQKQGLVTMPAKMDEYCKQHGFAGWFETSAKDNVNIEESAKTLVSKILINDKLIHNDIDGDRLVLNAEEGDQKKKFCSC